MSRLLLFLTAFSLTFAPIALPVAEARTIDNTGLAGSDIVDGMWTQICSTLPFCDVGEEAVDMFAQRIIQFVFSIISAVAVIIIVYSAIQLITARGEQEKFDQAKKTVTYAAAGLLISILAENLVLYVANTLLPRILGN